VKLNHAMVYVTDVARALEFYRDRLGLAVIEALPTGGYARLRFPRTSATLALHLVEAGGSVHSDGVRLYFEVPDLDAFCARLARSGVRFDRMPADQPWGWRHAYLRDPDGHELSLYRAGAKRLRPTPMPGGRRTARRPRAGAKRAR
jgi:hydroxymethylpyrimidine/phosphomethylpyrimidine kinase